MGFFSALFGWLTKLWDAIRKILTILLIVIAIVLIIWAAVVTGGASFVLFGLTVTPALAVLIGISFIVAAYILDADTASETIGRVADVVGDVVGSVAGAAVDVVADVGGSVVSNLIRSPVVLAVAGFAIWKFALPALGVFGTEGDEEVDDLSDELTDEELAEIDRLTGPDFSEEDTDFGSIV